MALTLSHYRFGIDELAESTHGWYAAEDVNPAAGVIPLDTNFLLRFCVQADATGLVNVDNEFQYRLNGGTWTNINTTSLVVRAVAVTPLTNGGNCTQRLSGTGTFETTGAGQTEDGTSGGTANDIVASGNSETECGLVLRSADLVANDSIEFRLTRDGGILLDTYAVVPTLTIPAAVIADAGMTFPLSSRDSVVSDVSRLYRRPTGWVPPPNLGRPGSPLSGRFLDPGFGLPAALGFNPRRLGTTYTDVKTTAWVNPLGTTLTDRRVFDRVLAGPHYPIFDETFEGTGYTENWSGAENIGSNCILDEDYLVSNISPPVPAGSMGVQCLRALVASPGTTAYRVNNFGTEYRNTFVRFHAVPVTEALADTQAVVVFLALNASGGQPIWALSLRDAAGVLEWRATIYHNGAANSYTYSAVRLSHRYLHEFKWSLGDLSWEWRIDQIAVASGSITGSATSWGFQFMKVGMDDALAPGMEVLYDNIRIELTNYAALPAEDYVTGTNVIWRETYEPSGTPGTREPWSDGALVESGNTFDTNANPADVGNPPYWGLQCLRYEIGATDPGCLERHQYAPATGHPRVFQRFERIVTVDGLTDGSFVSLAVMKQQHADADPPNDILVTSVVYQRSGALRFFAIQFGEELSYFLQGILTNQRYVIEIKYDATDGYYSLWQDGTLRISGVIKTAWGQSVGVYADGSSGGSTGRECEFYGDQYLIASDGFPIPSDLPDGIPASKQLLLGVGV